MFWIPRRNSLLLVCCLAGISSVADAATDATNAKRDVKQLIEQLGADEYLLRQRAETELLEMGARVFAELQAAERNADLEVATRAKYLLTQISIEWTRPTDSPAVQALMSRYGELSLQLKLRKIRELAKLTNEEGFAALARIARFDNSSAIVARYAALAIVENGLLPTARVAQAVAALEGELGEEPEAPANWIAVYVDQLQAEETVDSRWVEVIDEELALLGDKSGETSEYLAQSLLTAYLELSDQLSDDASIVAGLQRRISLSLRSDETMVTGLVQSIHWLVQRSLWGALSLFEDTYAEEIKTSRRVLYHLALSREKEGRVDDAQRVADEALAVASDDLQERNSCGDLIAARGHHDWAEREWSAVVEAAKATDVESLSARTSLAMFRLNDRLEHKAAADLLAESITAIEADPQVRANYETRVFGQRRVPLQGYFEQAKANRDFFLAAHYGSVGEHEKERESLEQAFALEPRNPDILIAMFHSKDASEEYRKKVQTRLSNMRSDIEKQINTARRQGRRNNRNQNVYGLANSYNHWAWLVSNTEGDFDKAVKYSQRSLELQPGSPSYLDTLGRCYFSAGEVEKALEVQREAVSMQPHLMVMQRQLQLFEEELEKREAAVSPGE